MALPPHSWATALLLLLATSAHAEHHRRPPRAPHSRVRSLAPQFLASHNALRQALGLPPLQWDTRLASYAASHANRSRVNCTRVHSNGPYGENIFLGSGPRWSPAEAVKSWTDEAAYYDVISNSCGPRDCRHYKQMVSPATTRLGCARAVCDNGEGVFITCSYDPPHGNYGGAPSDRWRRHRLTIDLWVYDVPSPLFLRMFFFFVNLLMIVACLLCL